jgi:hypothetical protein
MLGLRFFGFSMTYNDRFLRALGAWQNGWREDGSRRIAITKELLEAIEQLPANLLPCATKLPCCYRKRFLVPHNPQNGGDFEKLVVDGKIDEGVASWTSNLAFGQDFKELLRPGAVTALFAHQPTREEVVVDISSLWGDPKFTSAVEDYSKRGGEYADALQQMADLQFEIILNAPLLRAEVHGFVGRVGDADDFYEAMGADTEEAQDKIWLAFRQLDTFPGDAKWTDRAGAQRAMKRAKEKLEWKIERRIRQYRFRRFLLNHSSLCSARLF